MTENEFNILMSKLIQSGRTSEIPKLLKKREEVFWENEYIKMSREERIRYWMGTIGRQLRHNEESGLPITNYFEDFDFEYWKKFEPDIETIIREVKEKINY